ncbi:MAG: potassium channel family protein [Chloroflexota bacterium]
MLTSRLQMWRISWRDTIILINEFRVPLLLFTAAVLGGGLLYDWLAQMVGEPAKSHIEAIYIVLTAVFLQPMGEFPRHGVLQIFYFIMPVVGIGTLAQGLADFGSLLFNRRARNKEWEMAVASTFNKHIILVGLGHLGYRVVHKLHEMGENVAVIELNPAIDTFKAVQKMGIPVIQDDASRLAALESANVAQARTIILATQNDSLNLQIALKARSINPDIQVVVRIFDEEFAHALQDQFGFIAVSATEMAAPVFAAAAAGADVTNPISIEGQLLGLARVTIRPNSSIVEKTVGVVEDDYHLNIVLVRHDHQSELHPTDSMMLHAGDMIVVLGAPERLSRLVHDNE